MAAFEYDQKSKIGYAVEKLHLRILRANRFTMSHDQVLTTFAPKQDRAALANIRKVAKDFHAPNSMTFSVPPLLSGQTADVPLIVYTNDMRTTPDGLRPLFPRHPEVQPDADIELVARMKEWITWRVTIAQEFGRARTVIAHLNDCCREPKHVRYLWPSILPLLAMTVSMYDDKDKDEAKAKKKIEELVEELRPYKPQRTAPVLSVLHREMCKAAGGTIAGSLLLDDGETELVPAFLDVRGDHMEFADRDADGSFQTYSGM
jgi:hypothetical protein